MARRNSIGSSRGTSLRVDNKASTEQQRRKSGSNECNGGPLKICKLCSTLIAEGMIVNAAGHTWHAACFVCKVCHLPLTDYHKHDDALVCGPCMSQLFGLCKECDGNLGKSYVIFKGHKYHSGCFRCSQCNLPIGSKERYTLCEQDRVICDNCHQSNVISLISNERSVVTQWGLLDTTPEPVRTASGSCTLRVLKDAGSIRMGDVITAVNGYPLTPTTLSSLDEDSLVTLTLTSPRHRTNSAPELSPPSPPPPSTRPHKRRLLKTLSTSPPPALDLESAGSSACLSPTSYIFLRQELEIGDVIGKGYFGTVRRARLATTGENLCLKELQSVMDAASEKAFVDEVSLLKNLNHPNLLSFRGILRSAGSFALLTEYVDGGTLRALIKTTSQPLPWERRLQIAHDVTNGMAYLHSKEIIHRDLTSKNCLLRKDGSTVVADFGLAQYQHASHYNSGDALCPPVTPGKRRNEPVGAVYWRAPEMILEKPYDHKVDIFSFGIVMCELTARIKPDPDLFRTLPDWGVDESKLRALAPLDTPAPFLAVALMCCHVLPELRPCFGKVSEFLGKFRAGEPYGEVLNTITRILHSISEDD